MGLTFIKKKHINEDFTSALTVKQFRSKNLAKQLTSDNRNFLISLGLKIKNDKQ